MENKSMSVLKSAVRTHPPLATKTRLETRIDTALALNEGMFDKFIEKPKGKKSKEEIIQAPGSMTTPERTITTNPSALVKKGKQRVYHTRNGKKMLYYASEQTDGTYLLYAERPDRPDLVYAGWMIDLSQMDDKTKEYYEADQDFLLSIYYRNKLTDPDAKARCELANSYVSDNKKGIASNDDNQIEIAVNKLVEMQNYPYVAPFVKKGIDLLKNKYKAYQTATMTDDTVINNGTQYDNGYIYPKFVSPLGQLFIAFFDKNGKVASIDNDELDVVLNIKSKDGKVTPFRLNMVPDNRAIPSKTGEIVSNEMYSHIFVGSDEDLKGAIAVDGEIIGLSVASAQPTKKNVSFHTVIGKQLLKMQGGLYGLDDVLYDQINTTIKSDSISSLKNVLRIFADKKEKIPNTVKEIKDKIIKYESNLDSLKKSENVSEKTKEKISDYESEIEGLKRSIERYQILYSEIGELFELLKQYPLPEEVASVPSQSKNIKFEIKQVARNISPEVEEKMQKTRKQLTKLENISRNYNSLIGLLKITLDLGTNLLTKENLEEVKALNKTYIEGRDAIAAERYNISPVADDSYERNKQLDEKRDNLELEIINELFKVYTKAAAEKPETRTEGPSGNAKFLGAFFSAANNLKQKKVKKAKPGKEKPEKTEQSIDAKIMEHQRHILSGIETYKHQYNSAKDKSNMADPESVRKACSDYINALLEFAKEYKAGKAVEPPKAYWKDEKFTPESTNADPIPGVPPFHFEGAYGTGNFIKYVFMDSSAVAAGEPTGGGVKINQKVYNEFLAYTKDPEINTLEQRPRKLVKDKRDFDELMTLVSSSQAPELNPSLDDPDVKRIVAKINDGETLKHPIPFTWLKPGICFILDIMAKFYIPNTNKKETFKETNKLRYYHIYEYLKKQYEHGGIRFNVEAATGTFSRGADVGAIKASPGLSKVGTKIISFDTFDFLPLPRRWYEAHKYVIYLGGIIKSETGEFDIGRPRLITANDMRKYGVYVASKDELQKSVEKGEEKAQKEGKSIKNKFVSLIKMVKPEKSRKIEAPQVTASPEDYLSSEVSSALTKQKAEKEKKKTPQSGGLLSKFLKKEDKDFSVEFSLIEE